MLQISTVIFICLTVGAGTSAIDVPLEALQQDCENDGKTCLSALQAGATRKTSPQKAGQHITIDLLRKLNATLMTAQKAEVLKELTKSAVNESSACALGCGFNLGASGFACGVALIAPPLIFECAKSVYEAFDTCTGCESVMCANFAFVWLCNQGYGSLLSNGTGEDANMCDKCRDLVDCPVAGAENRETKFRECKCTGENEIVRCGNKTFPRKHDPEVVIKECETADAHCEPVVDCGQVTGATFRNSNHSACKCGWWNIPKCGDIEFPRKFDLANVTAKCGSSKASCVSDGSWWR